MGMFNKDVCPICNCSTNLLNKSGLKYNEKYVCHDCSVKLGKNNITLFNIKKHTLESLQEIVCNTVIEKKVKDKNILKCPKCSGHNLELLSNDKNYEKKYKTTININPLKPFTLTNTKEIVKEKSKKHNEYFCRDCGYRWIGK